MKNLVWTILILMFFISCNTSEEPRMVEDFNFEWVFARGDIEGAYETDFDDSQWRAVRLPHDWSVEEGFSQENTAGATAFMPGGIGWYRKSFVVPKEAEDKVIWVEFDGVYNNATVWINGHKLGNRPYGYSAFKYDLTEYLHFGKENSIVVKADRSAYVDCRWYPGSGIYRNVKLVTASKVHIPQWGTYITTPVATKETAKVIIETSINNATKEQANFTLLTRIVNPSGQLVAEKEELVNLSPNASTKINQSIALIKPLLWDTENPYLYKALSFIKSHGKVIDNFETTFGIREIRFDANEGFFLNGKNTLLRGVNLHHDGGLVGAAVPDGVWERRLQTLKVGGCNAIRTAHNPPSEAFLDLCDRMGFLVQDEAFDEMNNPKSKRHNFNQEKAEEVTKGYTEHFSEWSERDLKAMVRRDRNHASIIMWSIGNEIEWTYGRYGTATGYWGSNKATPTTNYYWDEPPFSVEKMKDLFFAADSGEYCLATTANQLSKWLKEEDLSRPVTANLVIPSVGHFSGYTDALDIIGYSYRQSVYDYGHENYPDKMIVGTENFPRWHEWKYVIERPFIPGMFIWTGVGYLGEAKNWPSHGGGSGLLNLAGFKNPAFHQFRSFWTEEPVLYLTTQVVEKSPYTSEAGKVVEKEKDWWKTQKWGWQKVNEHWNYAPGKEVAIEAYTNCTSVELFLNGKTLGTQQLNDNEDRILKWIVPYASGELTAKGILPDGSTLVETVKTAGKAVAVKLSFDKESLEADFYDVAHLVAQLVDANGVEVKEEGQKSRITFKVEGDCRILGVDNGSDTNVEGFNSNTVMTYRGQCLMIIQANGNKSKVKATAFCDGLESGKVELEIE